jgi:hypothetical protein
MTSSETLPDPLDFVFIKARYDFELQRQEHLTAALSLPVGVLSGMGSLMVVMARSFAFDTLALGLLFCIALAAAIACFAACLLKLAQAYHRQTYVYLPPLEELEQSLREWRAFYEDAGYEGAERDFFLHDLRGRVIEAADRNTRNNDARSTLLYQARICLFLLLAAISVAGLIYTVNQILVRTHG